MPSIFSPNKSYELQATGENNGTWGIKLDTVLSVVDLNFGGRFNANVAGNTNVVVSAAQAQNVRHILTGVLTGNIQYIFPNNGSFYIVTNNTTGAFTVTLANAGGGATVAIAQGATVVVFVNPDTPSIELVTSLVTTGAGVNFNAPTTGGSANVQTATFSPAVTLAAGLVVLAIAGFTNTGAMTFNANGTGAKSVTKFGTVALQGGEVLLNAEILLGYDGTQWQLLGSFPQDGTQLWGGTSGGSATVQTITLPEPPGAWKTGMEISWASGFNAGAGLTINPNALGAKTVLRPDGSAIVAGDFSTGQVLKGKYDGTNVILISPIASYAVGPGAAVTDRSLVLWSGTGGKNQKNGPALGTAGQLLTSAGAGADPAFGNISQVITKTTSYTLLAGDQGDTFIMNSASAQTFTLPSDATVGNGWSVRIINRGAGILTITRAGSDTIASGGVTNLTSIKLSQGDAGDITADGVTNGIFWWRGVRHFDSGQQTITSSGALTLAHGLGVQPQSVELWLHNVTAEGGYTAGQEVMHNPSAYTNTASQTAGSAQQIDATNIKVYFTSIANVYQLINTTNGGLSITNANWTAIWRAYVYN